MSTRPRVICVDDDPATLSALRRLFRDEAYEFITTLDPADALDRARSGDVTVLISDQRMPLMTGTQLMREVARVAPRTARVILTGYPDSDTIVLRACDQIDRLITKPWDDESLRGTISELAWRDVVRGLRAARARALHGSTS
jgi:serine/threonine-protein kinase